MNPQHFGIQVVAETFLPMDYIDFANPLAPAKPFLENRQGQNPNESMTFWAVVAGSDTVLGERTTAAITAGAVN